MPGFSIETFGGKRLLDSVTKQIEFAQCNALITTRQMWLLKEPLLRVQEEVVARKPETPHDWAQLVAVLEAEEGKPFWVSPVKQPESLFMDAPPELMVRRQDLAKFVRAKVCRYMPHEETRRLFLRKHHLSAEAAALPCPGLGAVHQWAHMLDGLYLCVLLQLHHRRQMAEAGVGLRAVYQLAEAIRSRAVRVPIRKQDGRVQEQFSLRSDHPVLGQVTTVLLDYGLVYLQIGWHRPAVVQVMREGGWTDGLRALRRGDRALLWVTGLQRNHMGHELVVATFQPPNQVCLSLDLPPSLLRHRVPSHQQLQLGLPPGRALSPPVTMTAGGGGGGPLSPLLALPPLIALSPPGSAGGVRRCSSNSGGGQGCSSPTFDHLLPPAAAAAPLTEGPSMLLDVRSSITSMGTSDARSTVALPDLAKAGGGGMIIAPQPAHQQRPGSAELAVGGGGGEQPQPHVVLIESLVQELKYGVEFQDPDCPEPLLGLRALGERLDLRAAGVTSGGTVTLDGPMDAVLEALDRVIRIAARWAVSANDPVSLAGLDMKYVSPRPVWLPSLQACSSARFSGPLGHPYHALEEEMWPRRFALVPLLLQDHEQQPSGAYLIVAESVDVAEGALETVAQWERQEAEEDRARKAKADAKAPLLFSPTSGTLAARKAASASHSPGGGGEAALRRPQS